ncbi:MAG: ATP-grasp domain-containing protein [Patescibacteria group bacterium]
MSKIRVGVLRGGPSSEYDVSLKTGANVLKNLPDKYIGYDIFVSRDGAWHIGGVPVTIGVVTDRVDVIWNALHGAYGEDGKVQGFLEAARIPYTGSGVFSSLFAMNKHLAKDRLKNAPVKIPIAEVLERSEDITEVALRIFRSFPQPCVVKPVANGSSVGVSVARDFNSLVGALERAFAISDRVLVEEHIKGKEATCGVVDAFRGAEHYVLPPGEIRVPKERFFDNELKYSGTTAEIFPGNFTKEEKRILEEAAVWVHRELGLRHYSRSDFIVSPRGIYFLESNTLPGLSEESLFPKALSAVGSNLSEFTDHVLTLAISRK